MKDNELIAEFMGIKFTHSMGLLWIVEDDGDLPDYKSGVVYSPSNNWNQLMPVLEKVSQHVYETFEESNGYKTVTHTDRAYPRTFGMIDNNGKWMVRINRMPLECEDTLIKATYQAAVEWIKAQNQSFNK